MCEVPQNNIQGTEQIQKPRVMYLDCDDTLLVWTNKALGFAAPMAAEFIMWAREHFEVRWLTMWCPSGKMSENGTKELSYRFLDRVDPSVFVEFTNPRRFIGSKCEAIDFTDPREWVWVEDDILGNEKEQLTQMNKLDNFYPTNVSHNSVALQSTWRKLAERFNLPGTPEWPYKTKIDLPTVILNDDELINKFRAGKMQNHDSERTPPLSIPSGWNW